MSPTYGDTFPTTGALDTDERVGQVKENDNVIVVGGPAINDLTAELAAENQTWDAETWRTGGYEGTSLLQMVDGWNDEQSALVVAGHSAEDTRTAAEFLANYGDHSDALSGESQVQISTETGNVVE
jgi:S-layer protein (TIGR01564 family)